MKILQIYKDYYPPVVGGIERHINILSKGLMKNGIKVKVLVSNTESSLATEWIDGIEVVKAPEFGRLFSAPINPNFSRLLNKLAKEVDLLHFHLPNPTSVIAFLVNRIKRPVIVTYHSDIVRQGKLYYFYKPFEKKFLPNVDQIIATSQKYLETSIVLKKFKHKCSVIPLGIPLERYDNVSCHKVDQIKTLYKKPIVLFVGKFRYYKGLDLLIKAMKDVDAYLVIIGNGHPKNKRGHSKYQNVLFLGEKSDDEVKLYMNACKLLVLPSVKRSEAYGLVLIEAMACGKAVISTELGTGTSFVNKNGETGIVIPANSSQEISKAINKLLSDNNLCEKYGSNGKMRVKKYFSDKKMINDTITLYENVLIRSSVKKESSDQKKYTYKLTNDIYCTKKCNQEKILY